MDVQTPAVKRYVTPDELQKVIPTLTKSKLATWRHEGKGPRYRKAGRSVLYVLDEVVEWLEASTRTSTAGAE